MSAKKAVIQLDDYRPENTIRTETVLSRFPLHKLIKGGDLSIAITKMGPKGKLVTKWEVLPSRKYGEPGILAYKIDTIVINKRFDEQGSVVSEVVKLGSLKEICRELGLTECGKNVKDIKTALRQNATASIETKLSYKDIDGRERDFEFTSARYGVVFTGEKLPTGQKADAVYIVLHPLYRELLNHARRRPLDYDYLRSLRPSSQRLYELLSYEIFAALSYGNPRARMRYSDLCTFAPLTRFDVWNTVRPQLHRIHKPHLAAEYISKVEFEQTTDDEGRIDWWIYYTPGNKARAEFLSSKDRKNKPSEVKTIGPGENGKTDEEKALISKLTEQGIHEKPAGELVRNYREQVEAQLEALPFRDLSKIRDRAPWLIRAIAEGYAMPSDLGAQKAKAKRAKEVEKAKIKDEAKNKHAEKFRSVYWETYLLPTWSRQCKGFPDIQARVDESWQKIDEWLTGMTSDQRIGFKAADLEQIISENPKVKILSFWEWDQSMNSKSFRE
jgi:hypothetical protein